MTIFRAIGVLALALLATAAAAADYPAPKQGEWIAHDFKFHTGETMPELKLHYTTIGDPTGIPVVVLHGSGGSAGQHAHAGFRRRAVRPRPAARRDQILHHHSGCARPRQSSKPSDGLKTKFPRYDYADMVDAQYRLLSEGLGIRHVRLIIGNSMGGMNAWLWGEQISRLHGCAGADGGAADRDGEPQLDAAADDARERSATIPTTTTATTPRSRVP